MKTLCFVIVTIKDFIKNPYETTSTYSSESESAGFDVPSAT